MSLRRFEAVSTTAALSAVRAALGNDAIILSNRRVGERIEIIASGVMDEAALEYVRADDKAYRDPVGTVPDDLMTSELPSKDSNVSEAATLPVSAVRSTPGIVPPIAADAAVDTAKDAAAEAAEARSEEIAAVEHTEPVELEEAREAREASEAGAAKPAIEVLGAGDEHRATGNTDALSSIDRRLQRLEVSSWGNEDPDRALLMRRLLALGLGTLLTIRLVERARGDAIDQLTRDALAALKATLPVGRDTTLDRPGMTIIAGPDTESRIDILMKLAAAQIAIGGTRSVMLVCADCERIGALETLEACGRRLGIAVVRAQNIGQLRHTHEAFADSDLVLVDAGREIPEWPPEEASDTPPADGPRVRRLLVLPATLQRSTIDVAVRDARRAGADGCIIARLDAAARLGECLDALISHWLPVCWWSDRDGLDAPLERADASVIVATAAAMSRRLGEREDDRVLAELLHPSREHRSPIDYRGAVAIEPSQAETMSVIVATGPHPGSNTSEDKD